MINPIALVMIILGVSLLLTGAILIHKRRKIAGLFFILSGLAAAALPFLVGYWLNLSTVTGQADGKG